MKQADITSYLIGEEKKSINNKTKNKIKNKTKNNSKRNNSKTTPTVSEKELLKRKGYWVEMARKSKEKRNAEANAEARDMSVETTAADRDSETSLAGFCESYDRLINSKYTRCGNAAPNSEKNVKANDDSTILGIDNG